uniref:Kynureninase n=1 Tax=Trichobilharzia regenti TaxID=157069 RepID=A0AA85KHS5_TRIRE|nr:unnamed protein product [Trichobilharzia regenti]
MATCYAEQQLKLLANDYQVDINSIDFALELDKNDSLHSYRSEFHLPDYNEVMKVIQSKSDNTSRGNDASDSPKRVLYFCGNSMGLQPTRLKAYLDSILNEWRDLGVLAYHYGKLPASYCDKQLSIDCAQWIVNAQASEVSITCNLSVNMHMLIAKFYRPKGDKNCILIEDGIFPSDLYVLESQINWHGLTPDECIIKIKPRVNEYCLRNEDILQAIKQNQHRIALIWLPGVQYVTGQLFNMEEITQWGHEYSQCPVGWDLAHAVGNVPLRLHDWDVDMAVWCSYKYLNGSPGAIGGLFVHERHHHQEGSYGPKFIESNSNNNNNTKNNTNGIHNEIYGPQLTGWWSHRSETRLDLIGHMELAKGADAYRISNPPLLLAAALTVSLDIVKSCGGMHRLREKSIQLTNYLEYLITKSPLALPNNQYQLVTPSNPSERGAQLTLSFTFANVEKVYENLLQLGAICDYRKPSFLRISPIPLYNSFEDVYLFVKWLRQTFNNTTN